MQNKQLNSEAEAAPKQKERRIVTWTPEEDDILREQISLQGTENWTAIASKFKDKTTRQCRRRWYTYLNSDFKKGGWSPEEDILLCEAQKLFGNRWTEIAKVVSGRTDNAVKNRFSTLCKKRAKREALAKQNSTSCINSKNKRVIIDDGFHSDGRLDIAAPLKKMRRAHIPNLMEMGNNGSTLLKDLAMVKQQLQLPFSVLAQSIRNADNLLPQHQFTTKKQPVIDAGNEKIEVTFLKKDDPKIVALRQQAELLSSLAVKVNADNTEQSLENAWKVLQNFLDKNKERELPVCEAFDMELQLDDDKDLMEELKSRKLDDLKDLMDDFKSSNKGTQASQRQPDLYNSPSSSEQSTGSAIMSTAASDQMEQTQAEICTQQEDLGAGLQSIEAEDEHGVNTTENMLLAGATANDVNELVPSDGTHDTGVVSALSTTEYSSPLQVTPLFKSLAATIPSPQFSESERNFLMKTLGIESPTFTTSTNPSHPPPCKRALVHIL